MEHGAVRGLMMIVWVTVGTRNLTNLVSQLNLATLAI